MNTTRTFVAAFFAVAALSCSTVAPVKVNTGEQCFRCGRSISDTRLAGEQISGFVEKFRAPGCMARYLVAHPDEKGAIFVTDYVTGKMVKPTAAFFVPFVVDDRTNESEFRAYAVKAEADAAAAALHTTPVSWNVVLDKARAL
jgi:hypothetical protein